MAVDGVVPGKEGGAEGPGILERAEAVREGRPVLEGLEGSLAVRIVIASGRVPRTTAIGLEEVRGSSDPEGFG